MGLETGSFVEDLVTTNPPGGDSKSQGDDHLRLIKTVLRNTFKRATKAFSFPGSVTKNANYSVLSTDDQLTFLCDTSGGAFTLTLPALVTGDAGWAIFVIKSTTDANPIFLIPSAGAISGFAKVRRSIDAGMTRITWTGGTYHATRPNGGVVGQSIPYHGTTLPNGHLWADGTAINATNYPELAAAIGANTPDLRGRALFGRDNMGAGAVNRITAGGSGITGTTLGAAGGVETFTLTTTHLPTHNHATTETAHTHGLGTVANSTQAAHQHDAFIDDPGHSHVTIATGGAVPTGQGTPGSSSATNVFTGVRVKSANTAQGVGVDDKTSLAGSHSHTLSGALATQSTGLTVNNSTGGDGPHQNMPPALICNFIVVAE